jgi:hypothetical protein
MERGYRIHNMVMYGIQMLAVASIHIEQVVIGFGQMNTIGYGFPIMSGVGHHSIMGVGTMIVIMDGYGYQIMNGHLHG